MSVLIGLISGAATAADRCDYEEMMLTFSIQQGLGVLVTILTFGAICLFIARQNRPPKPPRRR